MEKITSYCHQISWLDRAWVAHSSGTSQWFYPMHASSTEAGRETSLHVYRLLPIFTEESPVHWILYSIDHYPSPISFKNKMQTVGGNVFALIFSSGLEVGSTSIFLIWTRSTDAAREVLCMCFLRRETAGWNFEVRIPESFVMERVIQQRAKCKYWTSWRRHEDDPEASEIDH